VGFIISRHLRERFYEGLKTKGQGSFLTACGGATGEAGASGGTAEMS